MILRCAYKYDYLNDTTNAPEIRLAHFTLQEAAVLSYHIQHSWQKGFLASTHFEVAKHAFINPNCCTTESSRSIVGRKLIGEVHKGINEKILPRNMLISCLRSVAHRYVSWPLETNGLQMLSDLTKQFSSSVALAIHVESHNVLHVSSSFQSIISQFITKDSFLCADDLEFVFKNHRELLIAITDRSLSSAAGRTNSADDVQQINRKLELILVDDGKCECVANVLYIGSISLSVLQFSRISTGPFDEEKDGEFIEIFDAELIEKALSAYNREDTGRGSNTRQSHSSYPQSLPCEVAVGKTHEYGTNAGHAFDGKKNRIESVSRQPEGGSYYNDDKFRRPTYRSIAQSSEEVLYSSSSMSLQRACGGFLLTSDKHNVPQQVGTNHCPVETASDALITYPDFYSLAGGNDDQEEGGPCAEEILTRNPIVNIVYSGRSGNTRVNSGKSKSFPVMTSADRDNAPTLLSATTTVDLPLFYGMSQIPSIRPLVVINFESILQSILRVIPFHVVEIWLPVQLEDGSTVLLFGASAALDKALLGWSSYSRNFSFNPDVGLPGRVAAARIAESRTDVATLPMPTFLRADMAGSLGIHAACGLPFFTGNKCDAVVVFYSRHIFEPTPSLIEYMGGVCEMLNIRARIRILKPHGESARS